MSAADKSVKEADTLKAIGNKVKAIYDRHSGVKSRELRRNNLLYGALALFYLALIVFAVVIQAWSSILTVLGLALWMGLVWMQAGTIAEQRFIIMVQQDLHDLERDELERVIEAGTKKQPKPAKATA